MFNDLRAQTSVEFLVLTSFLFLAAGLLLIYSFNLVSDSIVFSMAEKTVNVLGSASDSVSILSPQSQKIVSVELPEGVDSFSVEEKRVLIRLVRGEKTNDFWFATKNNLTPESFSTERGIYYFKVVFGADGNVSVSEVS
ncbi:MAG: hypothetical protein ABIA76_04870 [Candidatus Diapherotrites archaeon]